MSDASTAVLIEGVTRAFGETKAVDGLSLKLSAGEVMGFLGTNGAGKTTTIKMLLGLLAPTSGSVRVFGGAPSDPCVRARVGYMPEVATYYPYLNARELLAFYGGICGLDAKVVRARTDELIESVGLADAAKRPLKTYSKGMLQRAGIAQALHRFCSQEQFRAFRPHGATGLWPWLRPRWHPSARASGPSV